MSFKASAMLAYGHDLTDRFSFDDGPCPAWVSTDDVVADATYTLLHAYRTAHTDASIDEHGDLDQVGLSFACYGDMTDDLYRGGRVILAAVSRETDHDNTAAVDITLPADADQKLDWALNVLGIEPTQTQPAWLLAASLG